MAKVPDNLTSYRRYFSSEEFWRLLKNKAKVIGKATVKPALCLYYMYKDGLSTKDQILVLGALGYLIFPMDLVPDWILGLGWTDDAAALAFVWNRLKDKCTPEILNKANSKLKEWFTTDPD
ncbi:MAG: DUF1232 domain-containing protein [Bacteroidales bacterium]|nr:DUF1232 domain-containing protein [Bacteroidales bacterium]